MDVKVEFDVEGVMRDGVILRANVYRPDVDGGTYPVLLTRLPYGKDTGTLNLVNPIQMASAGYIVVAQDCRGRYQSDGVFDGYRHEFVDGYDSVEWAASLSGSSGKVGMFGTSYYGFTQWAAAALCPPSLHCIAPVFTFDGQWNGAALQGGAFDWGKTALWYMQDMAPDELKRLDIDVDGKSELLQELYDAVDAMDTDGYWTLPLSDVQPLKRLHLARGLFEQLYHPTKDQYWTDMSLDNRYDDIRVPNFNVAGWYDLFAVNTIHNFQEMKKRGVTSHLLIGPWSHMNRTNVVGELRFPRSANVNTLDGREDFTQLHLRWFDAQLKGDDTAFANEAPVKIYVMGANKWREASDWPLPETMYTPFYLQGRGTAKTDVAVGNLNSVPPVMDERYDSYVYDPIAPVPTIGGSTLLHPAYPPGPMDQRPIEQREDVLVYTSDVLSQPVEVTGPVKVKLFISSSAVDTDFVVRLTDVFPDDSSIGLCDGILRMRFRDSWTHPKHMTPCEVYEIDIDCGVTSNVFHVGHRIRLQVTSSNFPRWNRNLNTGDSNELTANVCVAKQRIYCDKDRPSQMILPLIH